MLVVSQRSVCDVFLTAGLSWPECFMCMKHVCVSKSMLRAFCGLHHSLLFVVSSLCGAGTCGSNAIGLLMLFIVCRL